MASTQPCGDFTAIRLTRILTSIRLRIDITACDQPSGRGSGTISRRTRGRLAPFSLRICRHNAYPPVPAPRRPGKIFRASTHHMTCALHPAPATRHVTGRQPTQLQHFTFPQCDFSASRGRLRSRDHYHFSKHEGIR